MQATDIESLARPLKAQNTSNDFYTNDSTMDDYPIVVDNYVFGRVKDTGAFSEVFTAYRRDTHQKVSIKVLEKDILLHSKDCWKNEYDIAVKLNHQNIMKYMGIMSTRSRESPCFIMEYCCDNLANQIERK